jgi:hypothetical protein
VFAFVMASLVVWRITHFVVDEDGPWDVVVRLRTRLGSSSIGKLMDCFYCVSVWVAAPCALLVADDVRSWAVSWLALSGAACLAERATARAGA